MADAQRREKCCAASAQIHDSLLPKVVLNGGEGLRSHRSADLPDRGGEAIEGASDGRWVGSASGESVSQSIE